MSYTYLQERGEESSAECFSDIPASVLSRSRNTLEKSSCNDSETESCHGSRYGTTYKLSTVGPGKGESMSSAVDSPAKTSAPQEKEPASTATDLECGERCGELSVRYDRKRSSWKTHLCLWDEDLPESSVTLPKWGMMRNGVCWEVEPPDCLTQESVCGYTVPTPMTSDRKCYSKNPEYHAKRMARNISFVSWVAVKYGTSGKINPTVSETVMGWPTGWTDLLPQGTVRFHRWLRSHGKS